MSMLWKRCAPILLVLMALSLIDGGFAVGDAEARSKSGGKSFSSSPTKAPAATSATPAAAGGGFGKGLMGGLLGGAIGGMLFGSMFGAAGSGMGILPLLLLAGAGFFLYRKFAKSRQAASPANQPYARQDTSGSPVFGGVGQASSPPPPLTIGAGLQEDGLTQLKAVDRGFDEKYFLEVASDVFFQVQAGWMRRDLDSYRHLLGEDLAREYQGHLAELREKGHVNKLESIAVRDTAIVQAGSDGREDFVTVLFTANLLDYTVDESSGQVVAGSMTVPVKFREEWTWARPTGTQNWRLEGVREV